MFRTPTPFPNGNVAWCACTPGIVSVSIEALSLKHKYFSKNNKNGKEYDQLNNNFQDHLRINGNNLQYPQIFL